jgi:hypothetical protein
MTPALTLAAKSFRALMTSLSFDRGVGEPARRRLTSRRQALELLGLGLDGRHHPLPEGGALPPLVTLDRVGELR